MQEANDAGAWFSVRCLDKQPSDFALYHEIQQPRAENFELKAANAAAAISAVCLGAKALLAEATGCLGGIGLAGLVPTYGPMRDGERALTGGLAEELNQTTHHWEFLGPQATPDFWSTCYNRWTDSIPQG